MAKRPDFAQKLLDDLRMRKEQMGTSHSSNRSNQMSTDKYRYFKQTSRGLKEVNPSQMVGSTARDSPRWSGSGNRRQSVQESSKALVPVGRTRGCEQVADLSMAIAFALRNAGELRKWESSGNPMASFLNHFETKGQGFGSMDRNFSSDRIQYPSGQFPTLSNLQIKEISRGAQKLNQILKACSNGVNIDKYSNDIGKELLKGAMDLQESLRMLVSLQEASDHVVAPQRKQKIKLLEMEEDDNEVTSKVNKQKQLNRPRFSFDRPSRDVPEDVGGPNKVGVIKQRLLAISYPTEAPGRISDKQTPTSSKLVSHRKSASCGPSFSSMTEFSNPNKFSTSLDSQTGKGRIPSVIAKLMGLEELPANIDSKVGAQNDSHVKQGTRPGKDSRKILQDSIKKVEKMTLDSEKPSLHTAMQKVVQASKTSPTAETSRVHADKSKANLAPIKLGVQEGKSHPKLKIIDEKSLISSSEKMSNKLVTLPSNTALSLQNTPIQINKTEKKRPGNPTVKEQRNSRKTEAREVAFKVDLQRVGRKTHGPPKAADVKQENGGTKGIARQKEMKNASSRVLIGSSQPKSPKESPSQSQIKHRTSESHFAKLYNAKTQSQVKIKKGSENILKNSPTRVVMNLQKQLPLKDHVMLIKEIPKEHFDAMPSKEFPVSSHNKNFSREEGSTTLKLNTKEKPGNENLEEQKASHRDTKPGVQNVATPTPPVVFTNPVHVSPKQEVEDTQVHGTVNPRNIEEATITGNNINKGMAKMQPDSASQPNSRRNIEMRILEGEEEEASISRSNKAETSLEPLKLIQDLQQEAEFTTTGNVIGKEYKCLNELGSTSPTATIQGITTQVSNAQKDSTVSLDEDQELKSSNIVYGKIKDFHEGSVIGINEASEKKQHEMVKSETPCLLTEDEKQLKEILIKSQLFVNAAEALFELQIPAAILHASVNKYHDQESKVVLDCSYEVMKRKGRRKEFTFHPNEKSISVQSTKIRCLDDLVKELQEEIQTLKLCTKNWSNEQDAADCLQEMLEHDIRSRNPDVNSLWDYGWSETVFAYIEKEEVIKDVEKHVLNGLLDEFTREFF